MPFESYELRNSAPSTPLVESADALAVSSNSAASVFTGPGFFVPARNGELFRWCLEHGLRVVQPTTLMTLGLYNDPSGPFLPSIMY